MGNPGRSHTPNESVIEVALDDEALVLNVQNGMYYGFDGVGARIWQLLGTGSSRGEIVTTLLAEYEVEREVLARDVDEFIKGLMERGLLRPGIR